MVKLTSNDVIQISKDCGADLAGIAGAETLNAFPPDPRWPQTPERMSPDAKSVIVLALRVPVASFRTREPEPYQMMNMMINRRLDKIARRVSEKLEKSGYFGLVMNNNSTDWELKSGTYGHLSLRHLAVEAGMGTLGLGVNFMCVEYGPRVNLAVVVTDAELEPGTPMTEQLCIGEGCSRCLYACPTDAVLHFHIDKRQCSIEAQTTGFYGAADLFNKFIEVNDKTREKILNSKGLLVIDVPNEFNLFQTAGRDANNLKDWWVSPPTHLNYFSAETLIKLLEDENFFNFKISVKSSDVFLSVKAYKELSKVISSV